ncbi:hypothetical protein KVR01_000486 [Diaporthe batatas]|uniref:uncharacterized protein n=1 Tax=Diaporthe batatas TaxID=748121 RepID=UPI001D040BD9|nr:uncharacterized protein KVR01_000486 [Diaporthe batatas]KAG8169741.1 hypothetical protein KVR01_000486 [Diaporthe batatas]
MHSLTQTVLAIATLAHSTLAQFGGWGGGGSGYGGGDSGSGYSGYGGSSSGDDDGDGYGDSYGLGFGAGFDYETAERRRSAHGIIAAIAFVILFPLGAIFLRIIPGRWSVRIHYFVQIIAWLLYIAGFALGVILLRMLPSGGQSLLSSSPANAHPVIGIVVFIMLAFQPLFGYLHHRQFKRYQRRSMSSHLHLWDGRIAIALGIINGGLGLRLAGARETLKLAYTIVAAIMGGAWVILALISECRKGRKKVDTRRGDEARTVKVVRVQKAARHGSSDGESERSRSRH